MGAYLRDGLACPLFLQIAEEMRTTFPKIFKNHPLKQLWAYKYDSRAYKNDSPLTGIRAHADAAAAEQEQDITIRHLLTMTSGLSVRGGFDAPAGTKWAYNTQIYARTVDVLERASGLDRHELTRQWLTQPLGMAHSKWMSRGSPKAINAFGFATSARDLARFGLLMLAEGSWSGTAVFNDQQYRRDATSSSQTLNPSYGYLWWVNRNRFDGTINPRLDTAPIDLIAANGARNKHVYIVPSLNLVVTRIGDRVDEEFAKGFWQLLGEAARP